RLRGRRGWVMLNVALLAIVAVLGGVIYRAYRPAAAAAAPVRYVTVQRGTVCATVSANGNARPAWDTSVNFQASGRVSKIYVGAGQQVDAGQLLARLDAAVAELNLRAAKDNLASAKAALSSARSAGNASSGQVQSDKASVATDQASLVSAEQALAETKLRAPAAGTVVAINGSVGQSVSGGGVSSGGSGSSGSGSGSSNGGGSGSGGAGGGPGPRSRSRARPRPPARPGGGPRAPAGPSPAVLRLGKTCSPPGHAHL